MNKMVEEFTITLKYQVTVDTDSGEMTTKCIKRTIDKSNFEVVDIPKKNTPKIKDESTTPQLILEDNKFRLNKAAIDLMRVSPDDKIDIRYMSKEGSMVPVIGTDESFGSKGGNKLTKSNTVAFRGTKNVELSKYGKVFEVTPHETREGLFNLFGDVKKEDKVVDSNIDTEDVDVDLPLDVDLSAMIDDKDANIEEIDALDFKL